MGRGERTHSWMPLELSGEHAPEWGAFHSGALLGGCAGLAGSHLLRSARLRQQQVSPAAARPAQCIPAASASASELGEGKAGLSHRSPGVRGQPREGEAGIAGSESGGSEGKGGSRGGEQFGPRDWVLGGIGGGPSALRGSGMLVSRQNTTQVSCRETICFQASAVLWVPTEAFLPERVAVSGRAVVAVVATLRERVAARPAPALLPRSRASHPDSAPAPPPPSAAVEINEET